MPSLFRPWWLAMCAVGHALLFGAVWCAEPVISEFVAANAAGLTDEDGARPDWIEIHNPGPGEADLTGWRLTDDAGRLAKWTVPAVVVPAGGYRVIFASGKDRTDPAGELHTNFQLSAGGEYLALVRPDSSVAQEFAPAYPPQEPDRSFGPAAGGNFFFNVPTPGAANGSPSSLGRVAEVVFSDGRGLYDAPVSVALSSATPGATVRYTTNGAAPTATTGTVYTTPLSVTTITVVRAGAFRSGYDPAPVRTHTFIFPAAVIRQAATGAAPPGWPSGSPNGQRMDYAMDARVVDHADPALGGPAQVGAALAALPTVSLALAQSDLTGTSAGIYVNATNRGDAWERAASIEIFNDPEVPPGSHSAPCGLRIRGNFSRTGSNPKHSFRVFFRSEYGTAKWGYPLFGDAGAGEFDGFDIQTPQDISWAFYDPARCNYLRDTWSRATLAALGQPSARSRWVHLYLNGLYWGIYQIEERPEASFGESYLGGVKEDFDVIKATGLDDGYEIEATDGFLTGPPGQTSAWESLFAQCRSHFAVPDEAKYFALQGLGPDGTTPSGQPRLLEPDNFCDYLLMVMHSANTDMLSSYWVGYHPNNFYCLRRRGGVLGFISAAHDGETSLDYYPDTYDRTGPGGDPSLRSQLRYSNPEFFHNDLTPSLEYRTRFGDRAHRALFNTGALTPEASEARVDTLAAEIERGILAESARWGDAQRASAPYTKADWLDARDGTRQWFAGRREALLAQLQEDGLYPPVAAPAFSQHGGPIAVGQPITMSGAGAPILYTLDGTDPRLIGGAVSPEAAAYTGGVSTVTQLIGQGSVWKYLDNGSDQGTVWSAAGFDDSAWPQGAAQLGYGESDEATRLEDNATPGYSAADANRWTTTYFRRAFTVDGASNLSGLNLELLRDDGAVVFLNGAEVWRSNMPATGDVRHDTPAATAVSGTDEGIFLTRALDPTLLHDGLNLMAVEVHQTAPDSSDVSFDLRLVGMAVSGAQQIVPAGPAIVTLKARARAATGEWSALDEAEFLVGAQRPAASTLVISEIMYHPTDEDLEFVELMNIGPVPLDLRGLRVAGGIRFTFPQSQPLLPAGARAVVVRKLSEFQATFPGVAVAGEFSGSLDDAGDDFRLLHPDASLLRAYSYGDDPPWPPATDGEGRSLVLVRPDANPDAAAPGAWRPSAVPGGSPGSDDATTFASWKSAHGVSDDAMDADADGLTSVAEYFFGTAPLRPDAAPITVIGAAADALLIDIRCALAAEDADVVIESSSTLDAWQPAAGATVVSESLDGDNTLTRRHRVPLPAGAPRAFVRLRLTLRP